MRINPHKTVSANSKGIIISFRDVNKHKFQPYENPQVDKIQKRGKTKYQTSNFFFNKTQKELYNKALYGPKYYSTEELNAMSKKKRSKILSNYSKAKYILNKWKQEIVAETVDNFLLAFFPKSQITKTLVETKGYDRNHYPDYSFKELGITEKDIAAKLIEANLLPKNFFQLL